VGSQAFQVLLVLLAFQVKHLVCDFVLQTGSQVYNKGFYGRAGGIVHAGLHALFSVPVLLMLTWSPATIAILIACEFVVHYHADWLKARAERLFNWTQQDPIYWFAFGADQFVHQVTYIVMVAAVLQGA
jgi:hypothetical protein